MIVVLGRREYGREESADRAQYRERHRFLPHGKHSRKYADTDQQSECAGGRNERVQAQCGEHRQIEDAHPAALQRQRISGASLAQAPADREQHQRGDCNAREAHFDRDVRVFSRIFEKECHAEKQHENADTNDEVAAVRHLLPPAESDAHGGNGIASQAGRWRRVAGVFGPALA